MNNLQKFLAEAEKGMIRAIMPDYSANIEFKNNILQLFKESEQFQIDLGPFVYSDKIEIRKDIKGVRIVPGAVIRRGAFVAKNCIIMPSFINIGAYIDEGTMIDSGTTIGSCAQIGARCHISSGVVIGGVLEPVGARPVIIEDNVLVGANCVVAEGVIVKKGAKIAAGTILTSSTKIIDEKTKELLDHIPEDSVVVPGCYPSGDFFTQCAIIKKKADEKTNSKSRLNQDLR